MFDFDPVTGFVQDIENEFIWETQAVMEEGTGAMNITTAGREGHHRALSIGAFGRSQRSAIKVERVKRVALACVRGHPMADGLVEKPV